LLTVLAGAASPPELARRPHPQPDASPCVATAIDDLVGDDGIDLGRRGFELGRLGEGYLLRALATYSEGSCGDHGEVLDQALTVSTGWDHAATGSQVYVNQRQAAEPTANVLEADWASFWWRGYAFRVSVVSDCVEPPPNGVMAEELLGRAAAAFAPPPRIGRPRPEQAARAVGRVAEAPPSAPPAVPRLSPPAPCRPAPGDLLSSSIAALAPGLDLECFHRRRDGSLSDLGAFGLGDPRVALPAGWTETFSRLSYLEQPAAGCGGPAPEGGAGVSFGASFSGPGDVWADVTAESLPLGIPPSPGHLDDHSVIWNDGRYRYSVGVWSSSGFGDRDLVLALAAALDPHFAEACLIETRDLTPAEAVALGFRVARPPVGYEEVWSQLSAQEPSAGCGDAAGAIYGFTWSFFDGVDLGIVALLYRDGAGGGGGSGGDGTAPPGGSPYEGFLSWTDAAGTRYEVYGYSSSGGPGPAHELLVEVARSMDPTFGGS
jgi:hypothetical protein